MAREPIATPLVLAGSFAAWSLALALAAWSGLGRDPGKPAPAAEPAPLPALPELPADRLGALADYPQIVARPLFNEGRRPQPYYIGGDGAASTGTAWRLTGVMLTPMANVAILSGEGGQSLRLHLGGAPVQGWQLLELSPRQATVLGPSGSQVLVLATYDGSADAAATTAPAAAATRPAEGVPELQPEQMVPPPKPAQPPTPPSPPANAAEPSAAQMQAIRERIQARRRQMQQNNNGQNPGQNR